MRSSLLLRSLSKSKRFQFQWLRLTCLLGGFVVLASVITIKTQCDALDFGFQGSGQPWGVFSVKEQTQFESKLLTTRGLRKLSPPPPGSSPPPPGSSPPPPGSSPPPPGSSPPPPGSSPPPQGSSYPPRDLDALPGNHCYHEYPDYCTNATSCFEPEGLHAICCLHGVDSCITQSEDTCPQHEVCVTDLVPGVPNGVCLTGWEAFGSASGAIAYALLLVYCFIGLAIVCDDYFVASLEQISDGLELSEDVAGATFMAAGSSAPELFVSLADNVFANPPKSLGIGTIIGSAIFNILMIIGASAVLGGQHLDVDWRPLSRDISWYTFSIVALMLVVYDGKVEVYEGLILFLSYMLYIVFMRFNSRVFAAIDAYMMKRNSNTTPDPTPSAPPAEKPAPETTVDARMGVASSPSGGNPDDIAIRNVDDDLESPRLLNLIPTPPVHRRPTAEAGAPTEPGAAPSALLNAAAKLGSTEEIASPTPVDKNEERPHVTKPRNSVVVWGEETMQDANAGSSAEEPESYWAPLMWPVREEKSQVHFHDMMCADWGELWQRRLFFVICFPLNLCFRCTIPDCSFDIFREDAPQTNQVAAETRDGDEPKSFRKLGSTLTFVMSIVWIALLSHFLTYFGAKIGCILGISPAVMGLTVLAAGTSVPDALSSVIVAKNGQGDMAIANSIGSNVFDILLGLGFPWFLANCIFKTPSIVRTGDLWYGLVFLFVVVILLLLMLKLNNWRLGKRQGGVLMLLYMIYMVVELARA